MNFILKDGKKHILDVYIFICCFLYEYDVQLVYELILVTYQIKWIPAYIFMYYMEK